MSIAEGVEMTSRKIEIMINGVFRPLPTIITILLIFILARANGQDQLYYPDPTFNPWDIGYGHADGPQYFVYDHAVDPQGRIYIVGNFWEVSGVPRKFIARLHPDGSLDHGFDVGVGPSSSCLAVHVQSNGRILVGGAFLQFNGSPRWGIVGLLEDGSVDPSWPTEISGYQVTVINEQPDGKILIGGAFTHVNGTYRKCIARLEADGSLDPTFTTPGSFYSSGNETPNVTGLHLLPDGKIMINGMFDAYGGVTNRCLARLHPTGAIDNTFSTGQGFTSGPTIGTTSVSDVALLPDGNMIAVGRFQSVNGVPRSGVARLGADGTLDMDYDPGSGSSYANYANGPSAVIALPDGKCIVAGYMETFDGVSIGNILRLLPDGSLDTSFQCGAGADRAISTMTWMDDDILMTGWFDRYDHKGFNKIAKIDPDGILIESFAAPGTGFNRIHMSDIPVHAMLQKSDGSIVAAGIFTTYSGHYRNGLVQLDADGMVDPLHSVGTGFDHEVLALAELPDGRIVAGGWFSEYDGQPANKIVVLHANGSIDPTFNVGIGPNYWVNSVAVQPDGKIIVGGYFTQFGGQPCSRITRLLQDGSIDPTWNTSATSEWSNGAYGEVHSIIVLEDGRIILGGDFTSYNLQPVPRIARLLPDGDLDVSFVPGSGFNAPVKTLRATTDGKLLIGGEFTSFDGSPALYLARANADGSRDEDFALSGIDAQVRSIAVRDDGNIVIVGDLQNIDWLPRGGIALLDANGSLRTDTHFGAGFNGPVTSVILQDETMIVAAGGFTAYNDIGKNRIARLRLDDLTRNDEPMFEVMDRLKLHPNPAAKGTIVRFALPDDIDDADDLTVHIIDATGNTHSVMRPRVDAHFINTAGLSSGIYQILIEMGDERFSARLVVL